MKILVTGSSGFIAFHLIRYLVKRNFVLGVDSNNRYYSLNLKKERLRLLKKSKNFSFKKANIINKKKLEQIFKKFKPDVVFHLAGQPGVLYSLKNPQSYYKNNILGTKSLCEVCLTYKIKKFIFSSSSSVYGEQKKYPIKETFKPNPKNPYAKTKLESEKIIQKLFKNKVDFVIYRFFTVYGELGRPDMFIHKFLNAILHKRFIKLYNAGKNFRDFTYVNDVVKILNSSIKKKFKNHIYNICRSKPILTNELVNLIKNYFDNSRVKIKKIPFVKGEMLKTHGSNKKLKIEFDDIKFTDIKIGLDKTIKYFIKNNN